MILIDVSKRYPKTGIGKYCDYLQSALDSNGSIKIHRMQKHGAKRTVLMDLMLTVKALFNTLVLPEERFLYLAFVGIRPHFIVLHDLRWLEGKGLKSKLLRSGFVLAKKLKWRFIAASPTVRAELDSMHLEGRVFSLFNCVNEPVKIKTEIDSLPDQDNFKLIYVGSFEPRKNVARLLALVAENKNVELTIICSPFYWEKRHQIKDIDSQLASLGSRVNVLVGISDEELANEYLKSDAYVSLSDFEGFGRPLIEAQSCGLPVIAASNESTNLVLEDSFVDINASGTLKEAIETLCSNYKVYQDKGLTNSNKYSLKNFKSSALRIFYERN